MPEFTPKSSSLESFESGFDATSFTPDDEVRLHASNLGTIAAGRARAEALSAARGENVPVSPRKEIANVGMNLRDFRIWEEELVNGSDPQTRILRASDGINYESTDLRG